MFVSAGAGTGKTKVLVERFARAVCDEGVDIESILVITYTEKAAGRAARRIRASLIERGRPDLRARARRRVDLDDPRLLPSAAAVASVRGGRRPALPRARREPGPRAARRGVRCGADRLSAPATTRRGCGCSPSYGADGLRRMLTGVYETLRSAGRELVLELGERPSLAGRIDELREAARCLADDGGVQRAAQRETAGQALAYLDTDAPADRLFDLGDLRLRGERAASVRRGAPPGRAGGARRARRGRPRSAAGAARRLRGRVPGGQGPRVGARLRGSAAARARSLARRRGDPRARAAALPRRSWSTSSRTRTVCSAS